MCLALPAQVVEKRDGDEAIVNLGGVRKAVSLALVPEADIGDYVIVHVGHAIGLLAREEAEKTPIAKKVFESYNKFQAGLAPWDVMSEAAFHTLILARVYGLPGPMMRLIVVISSAIMVGAIVVDLALFR